MEVEFRTRRLVWAGIVLLVGIHLLYKGLGHAQQYRLETTFYAAALGTMPFAIGMGIIHARALSAGRRDGTAYNSSRWKAFMGPGYVPSALVLLLVIVFAAQIGFFWERFGPQSDIEAWYVHPYQRTIFSVANAILFAASGVSFVIVGGIDLAWWVKFGKQNPRQ